MVRRDPHQLGFARARWTLGALGEALGWLRAGTPGGLWRVLDRLGVAWKRGRWHVHSPDPDYDAKLARIAELVAEARASGGRLVALFGDEMTFYRQPTLAAAYAPRGPAQPLAERSHRADTPTRLIAALDAADARVTHRRRAVLSLAELVGFHEQVRAAYPEAERIFLIEDNWPPHFHPDVLVALEPQESPFPFYRPANWPAEPSPAAARRWAGLALPIQLAPLPTYAPWANPIEKLWRLLRQEVLHLHRLADQLEALRHEVDAFLDRFQAGSQALLRYVGLLVPH